MKVLLITILILIPSLAVAANVLIWNCDPMDRFHEPMVGCHVDCAYWVAHTLNTCGHTCMTSAYLPADLSSYDVVFVLLGWYRCCGDNCIIAPGEQTTLTDFLNSGKSVYLEGTDFGYDNHSSAIYPMFGCNYMGRGNMSYNVLSVTGQNGTFAQGMDFGYLYGQHPDRYVDIIESNGGTIFYRSQDNHGRAVFYNGPGCNYRAIHSSVIFGALRDGMHSKSELMAEYMDYLLELTGIEEYSNAVVTDLALSPNPTKDRIEISFGLSEPGNLNIMIYNAAGQSVCSLVEADVIGGEHAFIWDGKDSSGRHVSSGTYLLRIELNGEVTQKAVVLVQ